MIEIRDLRVRYDDDLDVVHSFALRLDDGEVGVIFGPNGGGKTTGLKAIAGILKARRIDTDLRADDCAYVHQDPFMFHRSVFANIAYALRSRRLSRTERKQRVLDVAARCDIEDILSKPATKLSGGQRQRVALARALALSRPIVLLDEPTANLDPLSRAVVARLVREEAGARRNVVIASHDSDFGCTVGDRFFTMADGILSPTEMNLVRGTISLVDNELPAVDVSPNLRIIGRASTLPDPGAAARAVFRPEDVVLSPDEVESSALNGVPVLVHALRPSAQNAVIVELVHERISELQLRSTVSTRSVRRLGIVPGARFFASMKASSVAIYPDGGAAGE